MLVTGRGESAHDGVDAVTAPPVAADTLAASDVCRCASADDREVCRRECLRLEANKVAAERMMRLFENPVLAVREYSRFVRDLNRSINLHNSVCKRYPVLPLKPPGTDVLPR